MKGFFIFICILLTFAGLWGLWSFYGTNNAGSSASSKDNALEVTVGSIQSVVTAQGTLEPKDYVDVGAQVSGEVIKLHVEIGDPVKAGDLLAEIDPDVYESQVKSSEAQLKMLDAQKAQ